MAKELIKNICEIRMIVGFLGEKHQSSWWESSFLSSSSNAFLVPVFPNSIKTAQYTGVCQAASIVHDEHIGIGRHYHPYRLPDSIERDAFKYIQDNEFVQNISQLISSKESALNRLKDLGTVNVKGSEGPVAVGDYSDTKLNELLKKSCSYYIEAFKSGQKTFPYMRCL